ncbi:MAG: BON domain-containing protein [Candidatus Binatia bacterium]
MKSISILLFAAFLVVSCSKDRADEKVTQTPAPDNSGTNVRDRNDQTKTAGDQSESEADRTISQNIRQSLTADDSLSTNGKNVKVITIDGKVTLRGPVKNDQEKAAIAAKAQQVAGVKNVDNQLEIATN